ncbi:MAG: sulfurtransferase [Pelagibacteraceae bacterium]|jgi:thiosulfate/3-mercaptopyruvate sulfurtransferase|nr:sulfurtransferase [Pelagibacteraceae bacterium]
MSLVTTGWLEKNLKNVKILDASWHMPTSKRNAHQEFLNNHIPGTQFFDLDKNSDAESSLPHMLPSKKKWQEIVSNFGINNNDIVVVYDNSDVISSCRSWYMFVYFGHDSKKTFVLDGGLKKWKLENRKTVNQLVTFGKTNYLVKENKNLVKNKIQINENISANNFQLIDARGKKRFDGLEDEPRVGLKSGHIQNSLNLPFSECINKSDHTFKSKQELLKIFQGTKILKQKNHVFTCGSGVTACILAMANKIVDDKNPVIYDGSWSEYGLK